MITFDWDPAKAESNFKKHGVSFEEASTVFLSDQIRVFADENHSASDEQRLIAIGYGQKNRILTVVHCYREDDEKIRIISGPESIQTRKNLFRRNMT
jgi:uncharacterized DUF497 family protein